MIRPRSEAPAGARLREAIARSAADGSTLVMPGVFSPFSALCAEEAGAPALYLTGAGMANGNLGMPDIALASLSEVADWCRKVCAVTTRPVLADADTGFGETLNVFRTVRELEAAGLAGIHLEDQVSPKRCGHLDGKSVIEQSAMVEKVRSAIEGKTSSSFVIVARTDARGVNGLADAIRRAQAYRAAGADAIFPEGLASEGEFQTFRAEVDGPLLANMTEFGKTPLIPASQFAAWGFEMVIFPMTAFRMMHAALADTYETLLTEGSQAALLDRMKTRQDLYRTLRYEEFQALEQRFLSPAANFADG